MGHQIPKEDEMSCMIRSARVKGEAYVSYSGKVVEQKVKPASLTCKCTLKFSENIHKETIDSVWELFYAIENKNAQGLYFANFNRNKRGKS